MQRSFSHGGSYLCVLLALIGLTACGFQLRGSGQLPAAMAHTHLQIANGHSLFARELKRLLQLNSVSLTTTEAATATLQIKNNSVRKEILSIGDSARVQEYRIRHSVTFTLLGEDGQTLLADTRLEQSREVRFDQNEILAASREEELLRDQLAKDLARLLINRLSSQQSP